MIYLPKIKVYRLQLRMGYTYWHVGTHASYEIEHGRINKAHKLIQNLQIIIPNLNFVTVK